MTLNKKYYTIFNFLSIFMIFLIYNNISDNIKDNVSTVLVNICLSTLILIIIYSLFCNVYFISKNNYEINNNFSKKEKFLKNLIILERVKFIFYILFTLLNLILIFYNLILKYTDRNLLLILIGNIMILISWYGSLELNIFNKNKKIKTNIKDDEYLN